MVDQFRILFYCNCHQVGGSRIFIYMQLLELLNIKFAKNVFRRYVQMLHMNPDMPFITTFLIESFTTNIALNPPNTSMNRHVVVSILCFCKSFRTNFAMVSNSCVFVHVNIITLLIVEAFSTLVTVVAVLPGMYLHVLAEALSCCCIVCDILHRKITSDWKRVIQKVYVLLHFGAPMNLPPTIFGNFCYSFLKEELLVNKRVTF